MGFSGVDAVTFAVADMDQARRFLDDWGLRRVFASAGRSVHETRDGAEVILCPRDAPDLPPAIEPGGALREVVWGAADAAALKDSLGRLSARGALVPGPDGLPRALDPNGLRIGFRVSRRRAVKVAPAPANAPGNPARIDRRAPVHLSAAPVRLGHVALLAADPAAMRAFYTEAMGFAVSDEVAGHGLFLRCRRRGEHHNLAILDRPGRPGVDHLGFALADLHEVIGGGLAMAGKGWRSGMGPGRHAVSSAYFWYFDSPLGPSFEYHADDDYCTEAWVPGRFAAAPERLAEWAVAGGIDPATRRQAP